MPRPLSWLPRLYEVSRAVSNSVRSHYDRRDIEGLFELQPRAALKLLEMLPSVQIGTSRLVEREVLMSFLRQVRDAEDVTQLFERLRREKARTSTRRIRSLVRQDLQPVGLTSLPDSIEISRGRVQVSFHSVEHLAESMLMLARILEGEGDEFARAFEPEHKVSEDQERDEVSEMFARLAAQE